MSNDQEKLGNVVKYNNKLNDVPLRTFTPVDMNLFWAVCAKMKLKQDTEAEITFDELKKLTHYTPEKRGDNFVNKLKDMSSKLATLKFIYEDDTVYDHLNLFQRFTINKEDKTLIVKVSEDFNFILNSIGRDFTRFDLEVITMFSSGYVKELYRQLMRHRDKNTKRGVWYVTMDDFKKKLSIPQSYSMSDIDTRIFKKAYQEFFALDKNGNVSENGTAVFEEFRVEKVKAKKANKISSLKIYYKEIDIMPEVSLYDWVHNRDSEISETKAG